jgi:selenocysteine lyase/cysteine desulfurase
VLASQAAAHAHSSALFGTLMDGLRALDGVTPLPAPAGGCPTVSFRLDAEPPAATATALGDERICVYSGDYYAYEYFSAMGLRDTGGAVRASIYHYNTADEVTRLLDALRLRTAAGDYIDAHERSTP